MYCPGNGAHVFRRELLIAKSVMSLSPYQEWYYAAPSKVFKEIAAISKSGEAAPEGGMAKTFLAKWGPYFWQDAVHGPVLHILGQVADDRGNGVFQFRDGSTVTVDSYRCFVTSTSPAV